jgi:hypothetical protein
MAMEQKKKRKRIPYGIVNFADIRRDNSYYVDKTSYIEQIEDANKYFFFIRPRRFGKSSLLSMLEHYYDINKKDQFQELFGGLYVGQHPTEERNSYLIIHLNFSMVSGNVNNYRNALDEHCRIEFENFCKRYASLLPEDAMDNLMKAQNALDKLQAINASCEQAGLPIYLFIDEYDHFTNDILSSSDNLNTYEAETHREGYLRQLFSTIKGCASSSIRRCFITGVSPVTMDDVTSGFNIGANYTTNPRFNAMVGFTEEEVRELLTYYESVAPFHHSVDELIDIMRPWYDGYCFSPIRYGQESMYNSNMVLYFLSNYIDNEGRLPMQMIDANIRTDYEKLRMLIRKDKEFAHDASTIQKIVEQGYISSLIRDSFPARTLTHPDNFVSLLFYLGMLTYGGSSRGEARYVIPNQVVREQVYSYLLEMYQEVDLKQENDKRSKLETGLAYDGAWRPYFQYIADCLHTYASQRDKQKGEPFVHGFTLAMTSLNRFYRAVSELDTQEGYADLFLRPEAFYSSDVHHTYIIEFKYVKMKEGEGAVALRRQEAIVQANRYAESQTVKSAVGNTTLHKLVIVFYGMEMSVCEEIL